MIETIVGINNTIEEHLEMVIEHMKKNGEATIRAIRVGELVLALEGSHRLEAAMRLEMSINIELISKDELVDWNNLDIDFQEDVTTYRDLIEYIGNGNEYQYDQSLHNILD